jgi:hypothetical protein
MPAARFSPSAQPPAGATICAVAHHLSTAIAAALDEMCEDLERYQARKEQRVQLARCIAAADELVEELEALSLAGVPEVPPGWQLRLDRFVERLPGGVAGRLRSGCEPDRLLDEVFAIEERLFRLKLGEWAQRYDLESG